MRLYSFTFLDTLNYAQASTKGTWYPPNAKLCPECNTSRQNRISPLIIEWEEGSDIIGDFVWPRFGADLVVVQKVKDAFEKQYNRIEYGLVDFWQNPKLKKPTRITHHSKPRVWLPYTGPSLWDVKPTSWCNLDLFQSGLSIVKECSTCGKVIYKTPLWYQRHLVVDLNTWNGEDIFHVHEYSGGIFCTERVKEFVKKIGFTNVSFREDGVIPD